MVQGRKIFEHIKKGVNIIIKNKQGDKNGIRVV